MNKQEAYKIVLEDLKTIRAFTGVYDATYGKPDFMYGVGAVMETIAENAGEGDKFSHEYYKNMSISILKAEEGR